MRRALVASVLLVACGSTRAPLPTASPPATVAAPSPNRAPSQPFRTYGDHGPTVAVETRLPVTQAHELSPDGLLLAMFLAEGGGVAFYDLDRGIVVGRAPLPAPASSVRYLEWLGDDRFIVATDDAVAVYDGRTGKLRGAARGSLKGFVATPRGPACAVVDSEEPGAPVHLSIHPLDAPGETLVTLPFASNVYAVFGAEGGRFLVTTKEAASAFDLGGATLWSSKGDFYAAVASPESGALLAPMGGETLRIFDAKTGAERAPIAGAHTLGTRGRSPWFYEPAAPLVLEENGKAISALDLRHPGSRVALASAYKKYAVSSGVTHAAVATATGDISVIDLATGKTRRVGQVDDDFYRLQITPGAAFVAVASLKHTHVFRGVVGAAETGAEIFTLPGSCGLLTSAAGALRLADCDQRWFDLRGAETPGFTPRPIDVREERWGAVDASVDPPEGTSFTARCPDLPPVTLGAGPDDKPAPGPTDPHGALKALRSLRGWPDTYKTVGASPSGRFAVVHEVAEYPGQPGSENVVALRVFERASGRERLVVRTSDEGFAFDPGERLFALAPVPTVSVQMRRRAGSIDLYDLSSGKIESTMTLEVAGRRPFFASGGAVVGYETAGGVRLVRRTDGHVLDARAFADGAHCDLFVVAPDGAFEGEPRGALGFRLGDDLRTSEVVVSGPVFEAHRRKDLVGQLFAGK